MWQVNIPLPWILWSYQGPVNGAEVLGKRSPCFTGLFLGEQLEGQWGEINFCWGKINKIDLSRCRRDKNKCVFLMIVWVNFSVWLKNLLDKHGYFSMIEYLNIAWIDWKGVRYKNSYVCMAKVASSFQVVFYFAMTFRKFRKTRGGLLVWKGFITRSTHWN